MTRKDYVKLAAALASIRATPAAGPHIKWAQCVEQICEVLAADNPRFNRDRFKAACDASPCEQ